jgi:glycosyltransferase involved in cell wall biosynthesis
MNPKISIIVPVYNIELYIKKCLDSIIVQTFSNIEIIVINDGSTDNSGKICEEYAKKDHRIKVVHKEYGGVSSVRNIGIEAAKGEFIGFVDGDDCIDKDMYQVLYQLCIETQSDISICKLGRQIKGELTNRSEEKIYIKEMDNLEAMSQLFKGVLYRFSLCNKLFKKTCLENIQFPEGRIHEDLATTYKFFANSNKAVFTNYMGYIYIKRENSILTSKFNSKRLDAFIGWDEILLFMLEKYPTLFNEVTACFVYGCVDNMYYVFNQVENRKDRFKYLLVIQKSLKKYYRNIIRNRLISLNYRYIITLINYNLRLLVLSNTLKKLLPNR